jgi:hypothetical protein
MRPRQVRARIAGPPKINGMVSIPNFLRPVQNMKYPADNDRTFERWYMETFVEREATERLYLPIQWTALYCNNKFGQCKRTHELIQSYLNQLDTSKKYYTIVQYDDGILNKIDHLDIKIFAMSGPRIDYALPLLCPQHQYKFNVERDIFASFVGRITHPLRAKMVEQLKDLPGYYIHTKPVSLHEYCEIMARTKYALCPRGYGQTSFRICEAIQYGAIPIYISDEFIIPYNMPVFPFGATLTGEEIDYCLHEIDKGYSVLKMIVEVNKSMFTYQGCKQEILKELSNEM